MKNKAVHKGNGLLPYPVIVSASQGDILAMNVVLCHYEPYIARLSMRTSIDEWDINGQNKKSFFKKNHCFVYDNQFAALFFLFSIDCENGNYSTK